MIVLTASTGPNMPQLPEFGLQAFMTGLMLLTGRWLIGVIHLGILIFNVRQVFMGKHHVDVTEVFRDLNAQKVIRNVKLAIYVVVFIICIYKWASPSSLS